MWDQGFAMQIRFSWLICKGLPKAWSLHHVEMDVSVGLPGTDTGSCDLVLKNKKSRRMMGIEFKTQRGRAFSYLNEPKPSHRLQAEAETYALENIHAPRYTIHHALMYLDREGQNAPRVFPTSLDNSSRKRVEEASRFVNILAEETRLPEMRDTPPETLDPQIKVRQNKGPNSIYLEEPWMCSYCEFKNEACPGALNDELIGNGIVGKGDHEGDFDLKVYNDDPEMGEKIRDAIRKATRKGNVRFK
jgi:hypothetical protein